MMKDRQEASLNIWCCLLYTSQFFNDFANSIAGGTKGGPAKVAVVASGLLGMINGAAVAVVVSTGSFTIPLMKKSGYDDEFAGAVVATGSVGGQLMPPVMGAAAFIMADTLGMKYNELLISAIIPAVIYYLGIDVYKRQEEELRQELQREYHVLDDVMQNETGDKWS